MSRLLVLSAIICAIAHQAASVNFTKNYQSNGPNTAIAYLEISTYLSVTMEENILEISQIWNNSGNANISTCKLIIDPFEDGILGRINAMGFMQSIIVWGVRNVKITYEIKNTIYTMLLVNVRKCTYRPLQLPVDRVPVDYPVLPPRVQIVSDKMRGMGFNVFYQTLKRCAPCQYFPKDLRITDVKGQTKMPIVEPLKPMHVNTFIDYAINDRTQNGFFLAYNYAIGTARLQYLDNNLKTLASRYADHTVDVTSVVVNKADRQNVAACWKHDDDKITCERYDSSLSSTVSYQVHGDVVSILYDIYENAYISTAEKSGEVKLRIYDVYGKLIVEIDFGAVDKAAQQLEVNAFLEDYNNPHSYCLVVKEYRKVLGTEANLTVKCINVREYTKLW